MADLAGGAFRSPQASPPPGGHATRFSFSSDRADSGPQPPHTEPLSAPWRVAEVLMPCLAWCSFADKSSPLICTVEAGARMNGSFRCLSVAGVFVSIQQLALLKMPRQALFGAAPACSNF